MAAIWLVKFSNIRGIPNLRELPAFQGAPTSPRHTSVRSKILAHALEDHDTPPSVRGLQILGARKTEGFANTNDRDLRHYVGPWTGRDRYAFDFTNHQPMTVAVHEMNQQTDSLPTRLTCLLLFSQTSHLQGFSEIEVVAQ